MRKILSFSISGTYFQYAIIQENGEILQKKSKRIDGVQNANAITSEIQKVIEACISKNKISGIAISASGQINPETGEVLHASEYIEGYARTNYKQFIHQFSPIKVAVENNVNCALLAESWVGKARDQANVFLMTTGNGLGGSVLLNGDIYRGETFSAGEIGYIKMGDKELGDLVSLERLAEQVRATKKDTAMRLTDIFALYAVDVVVKEAVDRYVAAIVNAITMVAYILNPKVVLLAGSIAPYFDVLLPLIRRKWEESVDKNISEHIQMDVIENLEDAKLIGAVKHFLNQEDLQSKKKLETIIGERKEQLTKREEDVANYIVKNISEIPEISITTLAKETDVSVATITRLCRKLGIESFGHLKRLADNSQSANIQLEDGGSVRHPITSKYIQIINAFEEVTKIELYHHIVSLMQTKERVLIFASDEDNYHANRIVEVLRENNIFATSVNYNALYSVDKFFGAETLCVMISPSGYEDDAVSLSAKAKKQGSTVVSITNQVSSPLGDNSDYMITLPNVEEIDTAFVLTYFVDVLKTIIAHR